MAIVAAASVALASVDNPDVVQLLFISVPLAAAVTVGSSVRSPFGEAEKTSSHPLSSLRFSQMSLLLIAAGGGMALASVAPDYDSLEILLRNTAGFAGLALVAARFLGAGMSWLLPLAYGGGTLVDSLIQPERDAWWCWPLQPSDDGTALIVALGLFALGLILVTASGARDSPTEVA
jgi:hypothetical protein